MESIARTDVWRLEIEEGVKQWVDLTAYRAVNACTRPIARAYLQKPTAGRN